MIFLIYELVMVYISSANILTQNEVSELIATHFDQKDRERDFYRTRMVIVTGYTPYTYVLNSNLITTNWLYDLCADTNGSCLFLQIQLESAFL
jgi:hypothetical protein